MSYEISGTLDGQRVSGRWNDSAGVMEGSQALVDELALSSGMLCRVTPTGPDIPCSARKPGQAFLLARTILTGFSYSGEPIAIEGVTSDDLATPGDAVA